MSNPPIDIVALATSAYNRACMRLDNSAFTITGNPASPARSVKARHEMIWAKEDLENALGLQHELEQAQ